MKILPLIIASVLLSGCATMSKEECKVANWKDVGFNDGANGDSVLLGDHAKSCAKTGVRPNQAQYMQGYNEGEKSYCTYSNGVEAGENNKFIGGICKKAGLKLAFSDGYKQGKQRYAKKQEIQSKEAELEAIEKQITAIKSGKGKGGVKALDLAYRQKEIINKEMAILEKELAGIQ